ncbi:MAG: ABC transporter permease [Nitrospinaceae bacterium]|nr:MAG: ABC transporter permease [Nitrospinaceae bacterium]
MKFSRLRAVIRKEFLHILRDPRSIGMGIGIPVILLLLFGYALTLDVDDVPIVVWDQSQSPASRELISRFSGSRYFKVNESAGNYPSVVQAIDQRRSRAGLIIPREFSQRTISGRPAKIQWIVDGSDSNTAAIATGYAQAITRGYSQEIILTALRRATGRVFKTPLEVKPRVWFNADLESKNYIVPGLIAVIMMVIAALLTSLTVAREWERGSMEQLISTPLKGPELILGKLFPYFVIGLFDVLLAVLMGQYLFEVPMRGSLILLFILAADFLIGALSLGILISIVTKNQLLANQLALLTTFIPAFILSGFAFPISNMPTIIQGLTHLIPARYLVIILKGVYLKGVGLKILYMEAALMALFAAIMLVLAIAKFRKKLE